MRNNIRILIPLLSLFLLLLAPAGVLAAENTSQPAAVPAEETVAAPAEAPSGEVLPGPAADTPEKMKSIEFDMGDSNALYEEYAGNLFFGPKASQSGKEKPKQAATGNNLSPLNKAIYDKIRSEAALIASGQRDSAAIEISVSDMGLDRLYSAEDLGLDYLFDDETDEWNPDIEDAVDALIADYDYGRILNCLQADCPYELYWYGGRVSYYTYIQWSSCRIVDGQLSISFQPIGFYFTVEEKYRDEAYHDDEDQDNYLFSVDTDKTRAASDAVDNAADIISSAATQDDYHKLVTYKDAICDLVVYDEEAAEHSNDDSWTDHGAWALVYVFDGDPDTNVVCEGYSEAYQYLCDRTDFHNKHVLASSVTGDMDGIGHKWNILHMNDGSNYIADITNSDEGAIGEDGGLFLNGITKTAEDTYQAAIGGATITYKYDEDTTSVFSADELELSDEDYIYETTHTYGEWTETVPATCTKAGEKEKICTHCHDIVTEEIPIIEHPWDPGTVTRGPTCTAEGILTFKCTACNAKRTESIPVIDHTWEDTETTDQAATCLVDGSASIHCSVCGTSRPGTSVVLPATGHSGEAIPTRAATYLTPGTKGGVRCSVCGEILTAPETVAKLPQAPISAGNIVLSKRTFTYNGKIQKPTVTVNADGQVIPAQNYTIAFSNTAPKNAGTYTVTVTMKTMNQKYAGKTSVKYTIAKAGNPLTVKARTISLKKKAVKKKAKSFASAKWIGVNSAQGKVTYKKVKGSGRIAVASNGKLTVRKGTKKGTYKITVSAAAAGNANYKPITRSVIVTIRVK